MSVSDHTTPIEYRPHPWYEGYRLGDDGSLWSCLKIGGRKRILTSEWRRVNSTLDRRGYFVATIAGIGLRQVHRLVLEAFVGPCPPTMEACHYNGIRTDNRLVNLRWDTKKGNRQDAIRHGTLPRGSMCRRSKLTEENVREIRRRRAEGELMRSLADDFGVALPTIKGIFYSGKWKHVI